MILDNKQFTDATTAERIRADNRPLHMVIIGTKPDIIKQAPLINELRRQKQNMLVVHSGQHYDWNLSRGLESEFDIQPDVNLNVKGDTLYEQQSQIIHRFGALIAEIKPLNRKVVPYTYSDTTTAVAAGVASFANRVAVAHVDAGLRTMSPPRDLLMELLYNIDTREYYERAKKTDAWQRGSYEPYPEQFDSRASAPSAGVHLAPTELNRRHLLQEGYEPERVFIVGNQVVDAVELATAKMDEQRILRQFPVLAQGGFIRFCVHRRENVTSRHRFFSIFKAMEKIVRDGINVLFISLAATERALQTFGLADRMRDLAERHKNLIYSPVWPSYFDVIAAMRHCSLIVTDSGSIQEEANTLGIPIVTLRFNTDRPETVFAGANLLAPPIREDIVHRLISEAYQNEELRRAMSAAPKLYGRRVSERTINVVNGIISVGPLFELLEHERLGFSKLDFWEKGEADW